VKGDAYSRHLGHEMGLVDIVRGATVTRSRSREVEIEGEWEGKEVECVRDRKRRGKKESVQRGLVLM
jgi:hypothetical protein